VSATYRIAPARSYLYVPGNRADMLAKATGRRADALIIDLEDAVAMTDKEATRLDVAEWISRQDAPAVDLWVRVNSQPDLIAHDVRAVSGPKLRGVYLPKVGSAEEVERLADLLCSVEEVAGMQQGAIQIAALVETARGLLALNQIATGPRVAHLALGEADLAADLGMDPSPDGRELASIRSAVVVASAAAEINPPIGPVDTDPTNLDHLAETSLALRRMGYGGRAAIHPDQIPVINSSFTPTDEETREALDKVARFEATNGGVTRASDGSLIDAAVVRRARLLLESAERGNR
jgi:citrate lyase subunit beta/citryl-CoA lyase